ncbi:hypothetical protein ACXIUT_20895 [Achromobacter denitrificans]
MDETKKKRQPPIPASQQHKPTLQQKMRRELLQRFKAQLQPAVQWVNANRQREALALLREGGAEGDAPNYLSLTDAAARLGAEPNDLLDKGMAGKLPLYAPVLHEGLYVWPVTDRGIPYDRLVGSADGVAPIFEERLQYGAYARLTVADLKKIKIEQSVQLQGYICPELVHQHLAQWSTSRQEEPSAMLVRRVNALATQVAWILAFPFEAKGETVRLDMLRVDSSDVQRLQVQTEQSSSDASKQDTLQQTGPVSRHIDLLVGVKEREDVLDAVIDAAIKTAESDVTARVWLRLRDVALNGEPPFTGLIEKVSLKGEKTEVEALVYQREGKMERLTQNALDARLRRRRKKAQNSGVQ